MAKKVPKNSYKIDLRWEPPDFTDSLKDNYLAFKGEIEPIMRDGMNRIRMRAKSNIRDKVYKGKAIESVDDLTQMYGKMAFRVGGADVSLNILEWGRGKGEKGPPIKTIQEWARSKGMDLTETEAIYMSNNVSISVAPKYP